MNRIQRLDAKFCPKLELVGGKAMSLSRLIREGFLVPETWCVTTAAFDRFLESNQLAARIQMELTRKDLSQCRWEELWDVALRIRNQIIKGEPDRDFMNELKNWYEGHGSGKTLAARSSSTLEDSQAHSFAGLHDSYIGISSLSDLEQKIRLVWASLWSDAVLSYRKELSLQFSSKMAVVIQPVITGKVSGICFSQNPLNPKQMVIEAVYGMNQGLVDGRIEPDRWFLQRSDAQPEKFTPARQAEKMVCEGSLSLKELDPEEAQKPKLSATELKQIFDLALAAENFYLAPQDVEWTMADQQLYLLQSRPVTTRERPDPKKDRKAWDLTLKRSFDNLCELNIKIDSYLSQMEIEGKQLLETQFSQLSDTELADEYMRRKNLLQKWNEVYWEIFIPFGHGMRLFGQIYNEVVAPDDPYEFVTLLQVEKNIARKRNLELQKLAELMNKNPETKEALARHDFSGLTQEILDQLNNLVRNYAMPGQLLLLNPNDDFTINFLKFVINLPEKSDENDNAASFAINELEKKFFGHFPGDKERKWAKELLRIGRRSFLLRDDDNVYLNRFKEALEICIREISSRQRLNKESEQGTINPQLQNILVEIQSQAGSHGQNAEKKSETIIKKRQMVGQPASSGYCTGEARIISRPEDIFAFKTGEVMICDAIGPELTFAVPMAAGIVERRGGMLIHGAIIAREYKIPCVTGISEATAIIKTGDKVAIDGHLGLVTILSRQKHQS